MVRSFEAQDLIRLPRFNGAGALALARELRTAAVREELPANIQRRLRALKKAEGALRKALGGRAVVVTGSDTIDADRAEDAAWSAIYSWLQGWAKLEGTTQSATASELLAALFPDGLRFTQLAYKLEWGEAEARLARIESDGLADAFEELGGEVFLSRLRNVHREYGAVLGVTRTVPETSSPARVREPLDAMAGALRAYAVAVAAMIDEEDAQATALAERLLAPLMNWTSLPVMIANDGEEGAGQDEDEDEGEGEDEDEDEGEGAAKEQGQA